MFHSSFCVIIVIIFIMFSINVLTLVLQQEHGLEKPC